MALDTLGYAKHLEQAGDVAKADLLGLEQRVDHRMQAMEQRLLAAINQLEARIETRIDQVEIRTLGVVAAMLGLLFALLKFTS